MRGFPKYLCTKADYEYVRYHFPPERRERDFFGALIQDQKKYFEVRALAEGEKPTLTKDQIIVEGIEPNMNKVVKKLLELREDPNCKMARLGIKAEDLGEKDEVQTVDKG